MWARIGLWNALLINAACVGMYLVARRLLQLSPQAAMFAGLAYALSPRMLTMIGPVSSEVMPMAALPWILVPLCARRFADRPLSGAVLSALAVSLAGGVNAVATLAVLVVPGLYLLTRRWCVQNACRLGVWLVSVVAVCFWWAGPLVLLGKYSPPFLDWIESSAITTGITNSVNVIRGASQWAAYIADASGPSWPAGHFLATNPVSVVATLLVAALALIGLARTQHSEGPFLALCLVVGFTAVSLGHTHNLNASLAEPARTWLDQAGAPFRNVHKFDPILRLPLCLGIATLWRSDWPQKISRNWRLLTPRHSTHALAVIAVTATVLPFLAGGAAARGGFVRLPTAWQQVGDYLAQFPHDRALVVPSAPFGTYTWGFPRDEPLQVTAKSPWAVRDVVPLSSAGNIRQLDALDEILASARGHRGLARALASSGTQRLVVRNDLAWKNADLTRPETVRATLSASPGIVFAAGFGKPQDIDSEVFANVKDSRKLYPIEVWQVAIQAPRVSGYLAQDALAGVAAETRVKTAGVPWLSSRPMLHGGASTQLVTDSGQRREHYFPRTTKAYSPPMAATEAYREQRPAHDYQPPELSALPQVTARTFGVKKVWASSSAADVDAYFVRDRSATAAAALDGDLASAWYSGGVHGPVGQWWQVDFKEAQSVPTLDIHWAQKTADVHTNLVQPTKITVTTSSGSQHIEVTPGQRKTTVALKSAPSRNSAQSSDPAQTKKPAQTSFVRVEIVKAERARPQHYVGVTEVDLGVTARVGLVTPPSTRGDGQNTTRSVVSFHADLGAAQGCSHLDQRPLCDGSLHNPGSETVSFGRDFRLDHGTTSAAQAMAAVTDPQALEDLVYPGSADVVSGVSSTASQHPWVSGAAAVDGSRDTAWIPARNDSRPQLTVKWSTPQKITAMELATRRSPDDARGTAAVLDVQPATATVTNSAGEQQDVTLVNGRADVTFAEPTKSLTVTITSGRVLSPDTKPVNAFGRAFHLSELKVYAGTQDITPRITAPQTMSVGCDRGLAVVVDGKTYRYGLIAETWSLMGGEKVPVVWCDKPPPPLPPGDHSVTSTRRLGISLADMRWLPEVVKTTTTPAQNVSSVDSTVAVPAQPRMWSSTRRTVTLGAGPFADDVIVKVNENRNAGWVAVTDSGVQLEPVLVDGWAQGWVLPAGTNPHVTLVFGPAKLYHTLLVLGALLFVVVLAAWCVHECKVRRSRHTDTTSQIDVAEGEPAPKGTATGASVTHAAARSVDCPDQENTGLHNTADCGPRVLRALLGLSLVLCLMLTVHWGVGMVMGLSIVVWQASVARRITRSNQLGAPWLHGVQITVTGLIACVFGATAGVLVLGFATVVTVNVWLQLAVVVVVMLAAATQGLSNLHRWPLHKNKETVSR